MTKGQRIFPVGVEDIKSIVLSWCSARMMKSVISMSMRRVTAMPMNSPHVSNMVCANVRSSLPISRPTQRFMVYTMYPAGKGSLRKIATEIEGNSVEILKKNPMGS